MREKTKRQEKEEEEKKGKDGERTKKNRDWMSRPGRKEKADRGSALYVMVRCSFDVKAEEVNKRCVIVLR